jgi:cell division septal protein FtsQ
MRLKPLRGTKRSTPATGRGRPRGAQRVGPRPKGRQAQRPGIPLRRRLSGRLPSIRRLLAGVAAVAAVAGLVALLNGPWLRVSAVSWSGGTYTRGEVVEEVLAETRGRSVLGVDTRDLEASIEEVPSVAAAEVTTSLTGQIDASVTEREVAVVWHTDRARFLAASDGTVFAALLPDGEVPDGLDDVPTVRDERATTRLMTVGDRIPEELLAATMRLVAIDPAVLGSTASALAVRLDDEFGFRLVAAEEGWEAAFGVYGTDPRESDAEAAARLERQVTAVRTLFSTRPEVEIGWVDVRNPGKVYFRAKG